MFMQLVLMTKIFSHSCWIDYEDPFGSIIKAFSVSVQLIKCKLVIYYFIIFCYFRKF